jgi:hypothetical protein
MTYNEGSNPSHDGATRTCVLTSPAAKRITVPQSTATPATVLQTSVGISVASPTTNSSRLVLVFKRALGWRYWRRWMAGLGGFCDVLNVDSGFRPQKRFSWIVT